MSVLRRIVGESRSDVTLHHSDAPWGLTTSGVAVDPDRAMRLGAVWSSVNFIADLISTLPISAYRHADDAPVRIADPAILADPSADVDPISWRRQVLVSLLLRGNAYGIVTELDRNNNARRIEIVAPDDVAWTRRPDGRHEFRIAGKAVDRWPVGPLWHLPAYLVPGIPVGLSPIRYAAQTIGLGLAVEKFGAGWFGDGAHPSAVLESDQKIDRTQAKTIKTRFLDAVRGREPVVLGAGVKYRQIQVSPEESQFLETIGANGAMVARFYGLRPEDIGFASGDSMTYANVEQRSIDRLVYPMNAWIVRLDAALTRLLPRGTYAKSNVDALVRVDTKTRHEVHEIALRAGFKSPDEVRELEELRPIPDDQGGRFNWPPGNTSPHTAESILAAQEGARPAARGADPQEDRDASP